MRRQEQEKEKGDEKGERERDENKVDERPWEA